MLWGITHALRTEKRVQEYKETASIISDFVFASFSFFAKLTHGLYDFNQNLQLTNYLLNESTQHGVEALYRKNCAGLDKRLLQLKGVRHKKQIFKNLSFTAKKIWWAGLYLSSSPKTIWWTLTHLQETGHLFNNLSHILWVWVLFNDISTTVGHLMSKMLDWFCLLWGFWGLE